MQESLPVDQRLTQGLTGIAHGAIVGQEITVVGTPTATMPAPLATAILLDDDTDVETHQRAHIGGQAAIRGGHRDALPDTGHAHRNLLDTRVQRTRRNVDALEQLDLLGAAQHFQRVIRGIQLRHVLRGESLHATILASARNGARGLCSGAQGLGVIALLYAKPVFSPDWARTPTP